MGEINLNNPDLVCTNITHQVVWVGVARHKYKSIDQGKNECQIYLLTTKQDFRGFELIFTRFFSINPAYASTLRKLYKSK